MGYGVDINARDSDGNTVMHVVFVNKNARPLSQHTPQMNKVQLIINSQGLLLNMHDHFLIVLMSINSTLLWYFPCITTFARVWQRTQLHA